MSNARTMSKTTIALELTISEPTEYVNRSLATASWWDRYTLKPGTYRVEWELDYGFLTPQIREGFVKVDAILEEEYRVNRLFTASSVQRTEPKTETTVHLRAYPWEWMRLAANHEARFHGGNVRWAAVELAS